MVSVFLCPTCKKEMKTHRQLSQHISASKKCTLKPKLKVKDKVASSSSLRLSGKIPRTSGEDVTQEKTVDVCVYLC